MARQRHNFTLIVDGPDVQEEALVDALFEAGCDDALVGRSEGIQYIEFEREATDLEDAMLSAVADVERVPGVKVARVADAGLVSMAEIAARTGRTREGVRLLVNGSRGPGGFLRLLRILAVGTGSGVGPKWSAGSRLALDKRRNRGMMTCRRPSTPAWSSAVSATDCGRIAGRCCASSPVYSGLWHLRARTPARVGR